MSNITFYPDYEFLISTGWTAEGSLDLVKEQIAPMREQFLKFLQSVDKDIKGINTPYTQTDADDGIEKWLIRFESLNGTAFKETVVTD